MCIAWRRRLLRFVAGKTHHSVADHGGFHDNRRCDMTQIDALRKYDISNKIECIL